jgi:hypothetical protein
MESWTDGCSGARCFLWDQMNDTEGRRMPVEEVECEAMFTYEEFLDAEEFCYYEEDGNMTEEDRQMRQQWKSSRR